MSHRASPALPANPSPARSASRTALPALATLAVALGVLWTSASPGAASPAGPGAVETDGPTILLVRHGETDDPADPDRALSPEGEIRALALADLLRDAGVGRILSTDFRRTVGTAIPLAERAGLEVERYDHRALEELAAALRSARGVLLVAGHSNTTPELVRLLGGDPGAPIDEDEHDRLYVVHPGAAGEVAEVLLLRYGAG